MPRYDSATREEVREWVVDQAISSSDNTQALSTRPCEKCSKAVYDASLVCKQCHDLRDPCIVTGYPIPKTKRVQCKTCKMPAAKDDWNVFVVKCRTCPWCGTVANAQY